MKTVLTAPCTSWSGSRTILSPSNTKPTGNGKRNSPFCALRRPKIRFRGCLRKAGLRGGRPLQGEGDQVGDLVAAEDHGGEASCDDREKEGGSDGIFHRRSPGTVFSDLPQLSRPPVWLRACHTRA